MDWTLKQIQQFCGNAADLHAPDAEQMASGVSIDTRTIRKGNVFVALEGNNVDGHEYIPSAFEKGAAAVLAKKSWMKKADLNGTKSAVGVDDPLAALQNWAKEQRTAAGFKVVAVTGSNGKTSTKEMIYKVLSRSCKAAKTEGNFNNHIGLPLSILNFENDIHAAVLEIGANHMGEIDFLSRIAMPDIAVITGIGYGHIGLFGSIENITKAKFEIRNGLRQNGILVLNADDPLIEKEAKGTKDRCFFYSVQKCTDVFAQDIRFDKDARPRFRVDKTSFSLRSPGAHMISNALAAVSVGILTGIKLPEIAESLAEWEPLPGRWNVKKAKGITLIDDAYNANPSSVSAALETLHAMHFTGRKIAVLADMLELGEYSEALHAEIGARAMEKKVDLVCATGSFAESIQNGVLNQGGTRGQCRIFSDTEELIAFLKGFLRKGDAVLFKASNRMKLGEAAKKLEMELNSK